VKLATAYQRSFFAVRDLLDNRDNPEWRRKRRGRTLTLWLRWSA
jgi:hypothetical protein